MGRPCIGARGKCGCHMLVSLGRRGLVKQEKRIPSSLHPAQWPSAHTVATVPVGPSNTAGANTRRWGGSAALVLHTSEAQPVIDTAAHAASTNTSAALLKCFMRPLSPADNASGRRPPLARVAVTPK